MAGTACAAALFVGVRAASADASGCTFGSSDGNVLTCISITGQGLFVDEIVVSAEVVDSARKLQVCIHGPATALPICTSGFREVGPGGPPIMLPWSPDRDLPAGEYCARTWRQNDDGTTTLIGQACEDVHP